MGSWKRSDPPPPAENTIGVTQSQILSVSPTRLQEPPTPPRPSRPVEMSLWGGKVLAADDFAPDGTRKARRRGRVALVVVLGGLLAAGGWLWHSWPKLPWKSHVAPAATPTVAAPAPATVAAPAPTVAAPAPAETAPVAKTVHAKKPAKLASSRHHHKSSRTKKHSHGKSIRSTAPTDG
ncbi:MAG TPA: hypothetical protein VF334_16775 [Polyangia bacterium]